jgi:SAM-dependent methyltransferase
MSLTAHWERQYQKTRPIWDADRPTSEVVRVVTTEGIRPGKALELGCGTGANAVWLALQGFEVTAIDLSSSAIHQARQRAQRAGVTVRFHVGDLRRLKRPREPFDFFLDCGCYGAVQLEDVLGYLQALERQTARGSMGLVLTGNDREPEDEAGPPTLPREKLLRDFGRSFEVICLREFRFDPEQGGGKRYLGWSCQLRRC